MPYHARGKFHNEAQQIAAKILPHLGKRNNLEYINHFAWSFQLKDQ